jgi:hypothetical protein
VVMVMLGKSGGSEGKKQAKQRGRSKTFHLWWSPVALPTAPLPTFAQKARKDGAPAHADG